MKSLADAEAGRESANRFLTERRLLGWAIGVALSCAAITMLLWPALHAGHDGQHCLDFNWIWLTGKLAASHAAAQVYHPNAALPADVAALNQFHCAGTPGDGGFSYPPTILFFTYPLGFMSYSVALAAWNAATLVLYLAAVYAILPRAAAVAAALTTYPVVINLMIGHNGFLTDRAVWFGAPYAFMAERAAAGVVRVFFTGLLTYKPHLGVLFPLALPASRNWRVPFRGRCCDDGVRCVAAAIAFGFDLWPSFLAGVIEARARVNHSHSVSNIIFPTALGVLRHFDVGIQTAWAVQAIVSALAASALYILWSRPIPHALKAAAIAIASLLATPYALTYDYCILSMAAAFLVKDGLKHGFLSGEQAIIFLCWSGLSLFAFFVGICLAGLTGSSGLGGDLLYFLLAVVPMLICAALLGQIIRRAFWEGPNAVRPAAATWSAVKNG